MIEKLTWKKLAIMLAFFYLPWIIVGWFFGYMSWLLLTATVVQLIWQLYHHHKLAQWLNSSKRLTTPTATGIWESIFNGIYQMQRKQRRRRKELGKVISRFRSGAEALPDAIVVFGHEGHIVWCNKQAQSLLGFQWPEDKDQPIVNLLRSPDFIQYLANGEFEHSLEMLSPLNTDRVLELRIVPYTEGEYLMVVRDVSQIKQLEGMRRNFFANVSHELRTPMTVLQGYLEMTEEPDTLMTDMWPKAHSVMTDQLNRMNSLVEQLLTLSKIEASANKNMDSVVNVPAILLQLEKEANALSGDMEHNIQFDVDSHLYVFGDQEQLYSAMSNLIYNAVKYTPAKESIVVTWQQTAQGAQLKVTDTGDGIEEQHINRLTERFYRVDKARSRETGGSGLGLAITKHALSHHDSYLQIESEVGQGSCFSFVLPEKLITHQLHHADTDVEND